MGSLCRGADPDTLASLFLDTTRLSLFRDTSGRCSAWRRRRPRLSDSLFETGFSCHEAPPNPSEGRRTRFVAKARRPRPKEPPPPPPPVAEVLRPVVPPKRFTLMGKGDSDGENETPSCDDDDEFSSDEFESLHGEENSSSSSSGCSNHRLPAAGHKSNLYDVAEYVEGSSGISSGGSDSSQAQQEESHNDVSGEASPIPEVISNEILISSSSWINVRIDDQDVMNKIEERSRVHSPGTPLFDSPKKSADPIRPPRHKKLAKLQLQQKLLQRTASEADMKKLSLTPATNSHQTANNIKKMYKSASRPDISAPVLLATTFNPNDAEAHKALAAAALVSASNKGVTNVSNNKNSSNNNSDYTDRLSFKELKRLSSNFFSGTSIKGLTSLAGSRSSFYVAEAVYEEARDSKSASFALDHIYEEIPERGSGDEVEPTGASAPLSRSTIVRPLPPIPEAESGSPFKRVGSIFGGASKYEILHYLRDAKNRIGYADFEIEVENEIDEAHPAPVDEEEEPMTTFDRNFAGRASNNSASSGSTANGSSSGSSTYSFRLTADVERNDSGVGSETSQGSFDRRVKRTAVLDKCPEQEVPGRCTDCNLWLDLAVDSIVTTSPTSLSTPLCCPRCRQRRRERRDLIREILDTEVKFGSDLRIVLEEFYRPMLVAGLLSSDQLAAIFLNTEELVRASAFFADKLRHAIDDAIGAGDRDLASVAVGGAFLEAMSMLRAFESYCTRQASATLLLTSLEREKELLKIFLKVSQLENPTLRRMNLSSFLMVPVQRVTKYPLLLSRLLKVTPAGHADRAAIRLAKEKIESALEQMNRDAKDVNTAKLWRRLPLITSNKKEAAAFGDDVDENMEKLALDQLGWKSDEAHFPLSGSLSFAQPQEATWKRPYTGKLTPVTALLAVNSSQPPPTPTQKTCGDLVFPTASAAAAATTNIPESGGIAIKDAALLLFRQASGNGGLARDPLSLERCIIYCEPEWEDFFEIQEFVSKESFVFKAEDAGKTHTWFQTLQFYTQSLGGWRKRRKGLANIMVDPKVLPPESAASEATSE